MFGSPDPCKNPECPNTGDNRERKIPEVFFGQQAQPISELQIQRETLSQKNNVDGWRDGLAVKTLNALEAFAKVQNSVPSPHGQAAHNY